MAEKAAAPAVGGGRDIESGKPPARPRRSMFGNMSPGGVACTKASLIILLLLVATVIITLATPDDVLTRLTDITKGGPTSSSTATPAATQVPASVNAAFAIPTPAAYDSPDYIKVRFV